MVAAALPRSLSGFALLGLFLAGPSLAQSSPSPIGQWELANGEQRYKVSYCADGKSLCARLVWLHPKARTPENLKLLNTFVVQNAVPAGERGWRGTVTYEGKAYNGEVTLVGEGTMRVNACSGMLCQSFNLRSI
ncbi:hypothetical protein SAMN02983003_0179 [Devosia enhydra]|uniref:DUF2147 domain-containing protein n=1 Tax=Devosia enhydra TaxID=665118 RepID=A0A1K2HSI1_9HYPH|nr:DUF2147 domain-containing protein [Devosia enhydra]SFZ80862.1 hypothetical protein SAMN02983003_0179 [Devosia enhydra]